MDTQSILKQLNKIFRDILKDQHLSISKNTRAEDVENWDSLNNIQIITATEKCFGIEFDFSDLLNMHNVGDMCLAIKKKCDGEK